MRTRYAIVRDTREKKPLVFPAILPSLTDPYRRNFRHVQLTTVDRKLETADYCLLGFEAGVVIERKGSLDEISTNVLTSRGRKRFIAELERLKEQCRWPYLLFEGSPTTIVRPTKRNPRPHLAIDALFELLLAYNTPPLFLPSATVSQRQRVGELAARLMVRGANIMEQS